MKKWLFVALSLAWMGLEGAHFQSSMSVTPKDGNEYLVEMRIEKVTDEDSSPILIASPTLICPEGKLAELAIGSEGEEFLLSVKAKVAQAAAVKSIQASILMKEQNQIVLSSENTIILQ